MTRLYGILATVTEVLVCAAGAGLMILAARIAL